VNPNACLCMLCVCVHVWDMHMSVCSMHACMYVCTYSVCICMWCMYVYTCIHSTNGSPSAWDLVWGLTAFHFKGNLTVNTPTKRNLYNLTTICMSYLTLLRINNGTSKGWVYSRHGRSKKFIQLFGWKPLGNMSLAPNRSCIPSSSSYIQ
jgi:hypothetical protein